MRLFQAGRRAGWSGGTGTASCRQGDGNHCRWF
jgi:hypothetical protein